MSPRRIEPAQAAAIAQQLPASVLKVGVFVDAPRDEIERVADEVGLDVLQLHGEEPPEALAGLPRPALKAVRVGPRFTAEEALRFTATAQGIVVDTRLPGETQLPGGTGVPFDWSLVADLAQRVPFLMLAGGLSPENVAAAVRAVRPHAVDVSSGVERMPGRKDPERVKAFIDGVARGGSREEGAAMSAPSAGARHADLWPDAQGHFGPYGGRYVPETLMEPLRELEAAYAEARRDPAFEAELDAAAARLRRPADAARLRGAALGAPGLPRLAEARGPLPHRRPQDQQRDRPGAARQADGQAARDRRDRRRPARRRHRDRVRAPRPRVRGLHGHRGHGAPGSERGAHAAARRRGARASTRARARSRTRSTRRCATGSRTCARTHYLLGSVLGPHPYPTMVRDFQSVIGREARAQMLEADGRLPDWLVACVGGGSNAIGLFFAFLDDAGVKMVGVEAGGRGSRPGEHAARFLAGKGAGAGVGVLHGTCTYLLQDEAGKCCRRTRSRPASTTRRSGPEHALLHDAGRIRYDSATDDEALAAFHLLADRGHPAGARVVARPRLAGAREAVARRGDGDPEPQRPRRQGPGDSGRPPGGESRPRTTVAAEPELP